MWYIDSVIETETSNQRRMRVETFKEEYRLDPLENRVAELLAKHLTEYQLDKLYQVSTKEQWEEILFIAMNEK